MTYTEFIKEIENNIAKANCNKLNMEEYEEKQKQIYKQIRADAIDEAKDEIVHHLNDYVLQEAPIYQDDMANQRPVYLAIKNCINGVIEITEQLKEQK